jgi:hypothetical protein
VSVVWVRLTKLLRAYVTYKPKWPYFLQGGPDTFYALQRLAICSDDALFCCTFFSHGVSMLALSCSC